MHAVATIVSARLPSSANDVDAAKYRPVGVETSALICDSLTPGPTPTPKRYAPLSLSAAADARASTWLLATPSVIRTTTLAASERDEPSRIDFARSRPRLVAVPDRIWEMPGSAL